MIPNEVPSGMSYLIQRRAESYNLPMRFYNKCVKTNQDNLFIAQ